MNINIKARIKRNKFDKLAGEHYRDNNSQLIKDLQNKNIQALLGIQKGDGMYTVIGLESIYYSTGSGTEGEISHGIFLDILQQNALSKGKTGDFEFLEVNENDAVWVMNAYTMNAMWNIIMLLHNA